MNTSSKTKKCNPKFYSERRSRGELVMGFDLDGTLMPHVFPGWTEPYPWVRPAFAALHERGVEIHVYSARFNQDFYGDQAVVWFAECEDWLGKWGLSKYVFLTPFKPPADLIFDDRGQRLIGNNRIDVESMQHSINIILSESGSEIEFPKVREEDESLRTKTSKT